MEGLMAAFTAFTGLIVVFGLIVTIVWISVPFGLFGIKPRLDRTIELMEGLQKQQDEMVKFLKMLTKITYASASKTEPKSTKGETDPGA